MTTMRTAVDKAARLLGVTMAGQTATGQDAADVLEHMQGVIDRLPLFHNGEWTEVLMSSAGQYVAQDGERINRQGFEAAVVLPTTYADRCGGVTAQQDLSRVQVIGDGIYVWASVLAAWNKADELTLNSPFPFGPADMQGIIALTVVVAADEYEASVKPITQAQADAALRSFRSRFYREVVVRGDPAFTRMSDMGFGYGYGEECACPSISAAPITPPSPPGNIVLPAISGTPTVGELLTVTDGGWA